MNAPRLGGDIAMATIIYTCGWVVEGADLPQQEQHRDLKKKQEENGENATCQSAHEKEANWQQYVMMSVPDLEAERNQ